MMKRIGILISLIFVFVGAGCATKKQAVEAHVPPHHHYYAFTEVLAEDYHVRLVVDHAQGEMSLIFEDISENAFKAVRLERIVGKALLPNGTVMEEAFRSEKNPGEKYGRRSRFRKRLAGVFTTQAKWVSTTPKFELTVAFPFEGRDYRLTFNYEVPGGEIPYHRK